MIDINNQVDEAQRLSQFLKDRQTYLGSSRKSCGSDVARRQWDDYEAAWSLIETQQARIAELEAQAVGEGVELRPHDHPDFVGGIVWADCELRAIERHVQQRIAAARSAPAVISPIGADASAPEAALNAAQIAEQLYNLLGQLNYLIGRVRAIPTEEMARLITGSIRERLETIFRLVDQQVRQADTARDALLEASSVLASINRGRQHQVSANGEIGYWQRREWVTWALDEVLPKIRAALTAAAAQPEKVGHA